MADDHLASVWLAADFATQIQHVLEAMAGEAPQVEYAPYEGSDTDLGIPDEGFLWWEQPFSLGSDAVLWIGASQGAWDAVGGRVLRSAGVEEVDPESARSTYVEIVTQALAGVARAISLRVRREISCAQGRESPPSSAGECASYSFRIAFPDEEVRVLAAFHKSLATLPEQPIETGESPLVPATKALTAAPPPNSIDLLLDVELPVSISFGRAQLPLKDVIKLTTGSIVELNRSVTEPVEVIVNNCVIARGEVVVVEGNFGIRIKQVISRQERLRTLS